MPSSSSIAWKIVDRKSAPVGGEEKVEVVQTDKLQQLKEEILKKHKKAFDALKDR